MALLPCGIKWFFRTFPKILRLMVDKTVLSSTSLFEAIVLLSAYNPNRVNWLPTSAESLLEPDV
jgi:hypothetical protein